MNCELGNPAMECTGESHDSSDALELSLFTLPKRHQRKSFDGAPGEGRTHNLFLRREALYPIELRVPEC